MGIHDERVPDGGRVWRLRGAGRRRLPMWLPWWTGWWWLKSCRVVKWFRRDGGKSFVGGVLCYLCVCIGGTIP